METLKTIGITLIFFLIFLLYGLWPREGFGHHPITSSCATCHTCNN